ncbi:hypothetical protein HDV06_001841 [Boothiomyces sp. JEL0866]|nr:hypothetical protein HDV06_001841 [Boothiomyces sp. JEL0866]
MKFFNIATLATAVCAHIHLSAIPARGLDFNSIGQEWEEGEVGASPCGNVTTDGTTNGGPATVLVRNSVPAKFQLAVENDDSDATLWVYAGVGNNVQEFPFTLVNGQVVANASTVNYSLDLSNIPGIKPGVNASVQVVQLAADTAPVLKYICADLTIAIKLRSPTSRGLTHAGTEVGYGELIGPCGADAQSVPRTVPGPYNPEDLQFSIQVAQADANASMWVYAGLDPDPNNWKSPVLLYSDGPAVGGNPLPLQYINIPLDFSKVPGLNGDTKATIQIVQLGSDSAPKLKYICADLTIHAPVVPSGTTTTNAPSKETTTTNDPASVSNAPGPAASSANVIVKTTLQSSTSTRADSGYKQTQTDIPGYAQTTAVPGYGSKPVLNSASSFAPSVLVAFCALLF